MDGDNGDNQYSKLSVIGLVMAFISLALALFNLLFSWTLVWIIVLMFSFTGIILGIIALFEMKLTQEKGKVLIIATVVIFIINIFIIFLK